MYTYRQKNTEDKSEHSLRVYSHAILTWLPLTSWDNKLHKKVDH